MLNKKIIAMCLTAAVVMVGCGTKAADTSGTPSTNDTKVEETAKFTGTKSTERLYDATGKKGDVIVTSVDFKDGEVDKVSIDVRQEDGTMKKAQAADGKYVMKDQTAPWNEQMETLEKFIVENKGDTSKVTISNEAGNTDAVSGVSIKVKPYLAAVQEIVDAVKNNTELAEEKGFTGAKSIEEAADPTGKKADVNIVKVVFDHNKPVNVSIDVKLEEGMKKKLSADGAYDMKNEGLKWHEQIAELEKFIVASNFDLSKVTITNDAGNTDAVSGVSIKVKSYLDIVQKVLDEVK